MLQFVLRNILPLLALVIAIDAGCGDRPAASASPGRTVLAVPANGAVLTGRVLLAATPPALPNIDVSGVADCARLHPDGIADEAVVLNPDRTLQNVVVYLKNLTTPTDGSLLQPAVLNQIGCRYEPHILALRTKQTLRVESADPFLHNVHLMSTANGATNFSELAGAGQSIKELAFEKPDIFPVRCDVHPWMRAWVAVFDHPWFSVTHEAGTFRLDHVPPGTYTLAAWHERFGELTREMLVTDDRDIAVDLEYQH